MGARCGLADHYDEPQIWVVRGHTLWRDRMRQVADAGLKEQLAPRQPTPREVAPVMADAEPLVARVPGEEVGLLRRGLPQPRETGQVNGECSRPALLSTR